MKRKREEKVEIMNSLVDEGFPTRFMPDGQLDQGYFSRHFVILAGLCDFIEKSVSCKSTDFVDKQVMVRDLLTRLELQLKSIGKVPDFIISELYKMTQSCYEQDLESILSSLQIVKMENKNRENKVAACFKVSNIHEGVDGAISSYWEDYLSQLKKKWKAKHVLFYLNENKALKADVQRKLLYDKGLISKKLFDDLKKFEEWGYYYPIINGVLYEAGFSSPLDNFYRDHFVRIDDKFSSIEEECMEESTLDSVNNEKMLKLLKTLKEYTDLVCGSVVCGYVTKMTKSFVIGDLDGLKSDLVQAMTEFDDLKKKIDEYQKLTTDQILSNGVLKFSVELKIPESGSSESSESRSGSSRSSGSIKNYSTTYSASRFVLL